MESPDELEVGWCFYGEDAKLMLENPHIFSSVSTKLESQGWKNQNIWVIEEKSIGTKITPYRD